MKRKPGAVGAAGENAVVDEKGRRRFHGAFTGGFSAGYYNTVGSAEGWKPATFVSSRFEDVDSLIQS
jgi:G patch domain-containing protein 1